MSLHFEITADNKELLAKFEQVLKKINQTTEEVKKSGSAIDELMDRAKEFGGVVGAMFAVNGAKDFIAQIANVRGQFQQLEIAFSTILGDKAKADKLMLEVAETAAKTPFDLQGVAEGTKQLLAFGTNSEDVIGTLKMLGDIASGVSAPLNDIIYLYGTTMTQGRLFTQDLRQFQGRGIPLADELAKQFKVAKNEVGDLVTAGKVGAEEFQRAMQSLAKGKFNNLMEAQSASITGQISNLEDSVAQMFNEIGKSSEGVISSVLGGAGTIVEHYKEVGSAIALLVTAYGAYKAAVIAHGVAMRINIAITREAVLARQAALLAGNSLTAGQAMQAGATTLLTGTIKANTMAMLANTKAMLTNPYVLAAVAITGLVYAIYKHATALSATEQAQANYNEQIRQAGEEAERTKSKTMELVGTLQSDSSTDLQKLKAWRELVNTAPKVAEAYDMVSIAQANTGDIERTLNESMDTKAYDDTIAKIKELEGVLHKLTERLSGAKSSVEFNFISNEIERTKAEIELYRNQLRDIERMKKEAEDALKDPLTLKIEAEAEVKELESELAETQRKIDQAKAENENTPWNIGVVFRLQADYDNLQRQIAQAKAKVASIQVGQAPETVGEAYARIQKDVKESRAKLAELRRSGAKADLKAIENEAKTQKELEEKLKLINPNYGAKATKSNAESKAKAEAKERKRLAEEREKMEKDLNRKLIDIEFERSEAEIGAMQDGMNKKLAQLELAHAKTMEELSREREDLLANKSVDPMQANLIYNQKALKAQRELVAGRTKAQQEEAEAMNAYLREYGSYEEKRRAIKQKAESDMVKAGTEGERLSISAKMKEELTALETSYGYLKTTIARMFGDLSEMSKRELDGLVLQAKDLQRYLSSGKWQEVRGSGRDRFGLDPSEFRRISESAKEMAEISKQTKAIEMQAISAGSAFEKMSAGVKMAIDAGDNAQQLDKALSTMQEGAGEVTKALGFLRETLGTLGDAFDSDVLRDFAEGLGVVEGAMDSAMKGAQAGAMFGPVGAEIGAAVGAVTSLIGSFAKMKDARHERNIQALQQQIESLNTAYQRLGKAVDKAYSSDASKLIAQQDTLLRQKQAFMRQQIAEEEAKKKTDHGKVDAWRKEIDSINDLIADNATRAKDAIFGSDVKSAINDFASAYADAWSNGNDRAEASRDFVRKQIKAIVLEMVKMKSNPALQQIRDSLLSFWSDEIISESEGAIIEQMAVKAQEQMDRLLGENARWLENNGGQGVSGSQRGFETMSQDTAKELNGRFTAIQQDVRGIALALTEVRNIHLMSVGHLETIGRNTAQLYGISERLEAIERNTRALK